jgi:hypothetical protein
MKLLGQDWGSIDLPNRKPSVARRRRMSFTVIIPMGYYPLNTAHRAPDARDLSSRRLAQDPESQRQRCSQDRPDEVAPRRWRSSTD